MAIFIEIFKILINLGSKKNLHSKKNILEILNFFTVKKLMENLHSVNFLIKRIKDFQKKKF